MRRSIIIIAAAAIAAGTDRWREERQTDDND